MYLKAVIHLNYLSVFSTVPSTPKQRTDGSTPPTQAADPAAASQAAEAFVIATVYVCNLSFSGPTYTGARYLRPVA
jgi:hypothetical protein